MTKNILRICFFISIFICCFGNLLPGQKARSQKPSLVVVIVIDGFRHDYLTRFKSQFSRGGFEFLLGRGANFINAHVNHLRASTGAGHATILTGASGHLSGIVDNEWYDRSLHRNVNCVEDPSAPFLGEDHGAKDKTAGRSPKSLNVSTVGDQLRLATNLRSKVVGISYKDRAAILLGGRLANAAYWWEPTTGDFVSSTYYMNELPKWVKRFNQEKFVNQFFRRHWDKLLDDHAYAVSRADSFPHEMDYKGMGIVFPHLVDGSSKNPDKEFYEAFSHTPWADSHLAAFAKAVIENENLGNGDFTDILAISFSATDRIGHLFGPYSVEIQDQVLRLDRLLKDLFAYLDKKIGVNNIIIALTADHGTGPIPEYMAGLNIDGGRIDVIPSIVDSVLDRQYGQGDWVEAFLKPSVYLSHGEIKIRNLKSADVENTAAEELRRVREITHVVTRTQLTMGDLPPDIIPRRFLNQFYPSRSGDILVHWKPY
ncbi:alkaline phosphatase family protein [Acidobacteria bacterium AH-259-O06]|nr:alkaline phosphatase family protein [Acidobacteria bacterium AH-259-O06]